MNAATWLSTQPGLESPGINSVANADVMSAYKRSGAFRQGPSTSPTSLLTPQGRVFNADGKRRRLGRNTHHVRVRGGEVAHPASKVHGIPVFVVKPDSAYFELTPRFQNGVLVRGPEIANRLGENSTFATLQQLQTALFNEPKPDPDDPNDRHMTVLEILADIAPFGIGVNEDPDDNLIPTDRETVNGCEIHFTTGKVADIVSFFGHAVRMGQTVGFIVKRVKAEDYVANGWDIFAAYSGDVPRKMEYNDERTEHPFQIVPYVGWGEPSLMDRMYKNPDGKGNQFGAYLRCGIFDHSKEGTSTRYNEALANAVEATKIGTTVIHQVPMTWVF